MERRGEMKNIRIYAIFKQIKIWHTLIDLHL